MAKLSVWSGNDIPPTAHARAKRLVGDSVFSPTNTGFSEEALNDLLVAVAALQLAAANATDAGTGATRRTRRTAGTWGSDFVPALLQKRMCSLTNAAQVQSVSACRDRSRPWPCAQSRAFHDCLRMHSSVVLRSGEVLLPDIEMALLTPTLPTFSGAVKRARGRPEGGFKCGCTGGYWRLESGLRSRAGECKAVGGQWGAHRSSRDRDDSVTPTLAPVGQLEERPVEGQSVAGSATVDVIQWANLVPLRRRAACSRAGQGGGPPSSTDLSAMP